MSFKEFQFHTKISAGIKRCGYNEPTPIQQEAIPHILAGRDIIALAQTGTGKTAAFVLPILQRLLKGPRARVRALIVAPTRELAEQIHDNICRMAVQTGIRSVVVYGGVGKQPQLKGIRAGAEIIVACPGRLLDLLNGKTFNLRGVELLVLDEADHMFDKGFLPDIRKIIKQLPGKRQSLVFSATMPEPIRHLLEEILDKPITVQINHTQPAPTVSHLLFQVANTKKTALLKNILKNHDMTSTLVFTRTKYKAKNLALHLEKAGFSAVSLQGNLSQSKRQRAMDGFRDGTFNILVATDIAARGIDVRAISHVINYDVPDTAETYTHRTGRTGRATLSGKAYTFANYDDGKMITLIERSLGKKMVREPLPTLVEISGDTRDRQKRKYFSGPKQKKNKPNMVGRGSNRRAGENTFDFGVGNPGR